MDKTEIDAKKIFECLVRVRVPEIEGLAIPENWGHWKSRICSEFLLSSAIQTLISQSLDAAVASDYQSHILFSSPMISTKCEYKIKMPEKKRIWDEIAQRLC